MSEDCDRDGERDEGRKGRTQDRDSSDGYARLSVAFCKVEEEIFNAAKQRHAVDPGGDGSESESEEEGDTLSDDGGSNNTDLGGCAFPGPRADFELDGAANLGSMLLRGMLSEKELDGFPNSSGTCKEPDITGEVDNETPTDEDWKNL